MDLRFFAERFFILNKKEILPQSPFRSAWRFSCLFVLVVFLNSGSGLEMLSRVPYRRSRRRIPGLSPVAAIRMPERSGYGEAPGRARLGAVGTRSRAIRGCTSRGPFCAHGSG